MLDVLGMNIHHMAHIFSHFFFTAPILKNKSIPLFPQPVEQTVGIECEKLGRASVR